MRYRVQIHESGFSDSLLRSLLEDPIIDVLTAMGVSVELEVEGLGPAKSAAAVPDADGGGDADVAEGATAAG